MYSDIENDYMSETYNDDITTEDETLNALKKLSNRNDIKAIRRYIIIHSAKLKGYKTRLLNDVINVKGYKFLRRDGKLIIVKISPSSPHYNPNDYIKREQINDIKERTSSEGDKRDFSHKANARMYASDKDTSNGEFEGSSIIITPSEADSETSLNMNSYIIFETCSVVFARTNTSGITSIPPNSSCA